MNYTSYSSQTIQSVFQIFLKSILKAGLGFHLVFGFNTLNKTQMYVFSWNLIWHKNRLADWIWTHILTVKLFEIFGTNQYIANSQTDQNEIIQNNRIYYIVKECSLNYYYIILLCYWKQYRLNVCILLWRNFNWGNMVLTKNSYNII